ncbi:hypothetical protein cypCar_00023025 [Cyprinus carpio]|nr:hypothetical protein cypCar_00023025 [Cyprinus carpio]
MHLDYALLELDDVDKIAEYPRLLDCYHPNVPINRGSSGSPVFDVDCNLIGIHTGGYKYEVEDKSWYIMEYGFSMQPILDNIRAQARMKGLPDIVSVIEAYSNVSGTAEQQNQNDIEMKDAEESDEL